MHFTSLYSNVYKYGLRAESRAGEVKQILNEVCEAEFGTFPCRVGGNTAIGLIEGVQLIAGTADIAAIRRFAPRARLELFGLSSFYGPRIAGQVPGVLRELREHPATRRAVLFVGSGADNPDTLPCTNTIQFHQQYPGSVYLTTLATMRSSDLVWGLPYDIIQFSMLGYAVAACCEMVARDVTVMTANAHIYTETAVPIDAWDKGSFTMPHCNEWSDWVAWARSIVYNEDITRSQFLDIFGVKLPTKGGDARSTPANI